ncbi:TetR family transcriptional regulator [soil metagenome]
MPRSSKQAAAKTRGAVLDRAVDIGSAEGLETLSIGRLAGELRMSKIGVVGQFGSKLELQLAAIEAANRRFRAEVWDPVAAEPEGLPRLRAVMGSWISYLEREVFPGGCFLTAAAIEFDDRPGPVRDAIGNAWGLWMRVLEREVAVAQRAGDLGEYPGPAQLAFELHSAVLGGNFARQLFGGEDALSPSRAAVARLLGHEP